MLAVGQKKMEKENSYLCTAIFVDALMTALFIMLTM